MVAEFEVNRRVSRVAPTAALAGVADRVTALGLGYGACPAGATPVSGPTFRPEDVAQAFRLALEVAKAPYQALFISAPDGLNTLPTLDMLRSLRHAAGNSQTSPVPPP